MAIGSPPISWDLKHTSEPLVYIDTPLPNSSGNTGVMVCVVMVYANFQDDRFSGLGVKGNKQTYFLHL